MEEDRNATKKPGPVKPKPEEKENPKLPQEKEITSGIGLQRSTSGFTYGQRMVRLGSVRNGDRVEKVKEHYAELIDYLHNLRETAHDAEQTRLYALAITQAEDACMWAVKALTWAP